MRINLRFRRTTNRATICAVLGTLALIAAAHGQASPTRAQTGFQPQATTDQALISRHSALGRLGALGAAVDRGALARHRALGRLGELQVMVNRSAILRHRALGRLPGALALGRTQAGDQDSSFAAITWLRATTLSGAGLALLITTYVLVRYGRRRRRRPSQDALVRTELG